MHYVVVVPLTQIHDHPAKEIDGHMLIIDAPLKPGAKPIMLRKIDSANDVGKGSPLGLQSEPLTLTKGVNPGMWVVVTIHYRDVFTGLPYHQGFFFRWHGIRGMDKDGKELYDPKLFNTSVATKMELIKHVKEAVGVQVPPN